MIEVHRDDLKRRLVWVVTDQTTVGDLIESVDHQAVDGTWSYTVLYDARQRTNLLNPEELRQLAERVAQHVAQLGPRNKLAVVIPLHMHDFKRMYEIFAAVVDPNNRAFTNVPDAEQWLDGLTSA